MNTKYTFRKGNIADLEQIKSITWMAYSQFKNIFSEENFQGWNEILNKDETYLNLFETAVCFVCEKENKIIGSAFLVPHGNPFKWFEADWSYIRLVAVHTEYEGNGIGKKLTQMCIDKAKEMDEKIIALHTSEFQNAARHIYESMGFEKQKEFELYEKKYWIYLLNL
ncbi:MAG: GNAT family N-acetyltransferase [Saprospiraceae bacterium]|nr:GNAT family N-acetyltransferase [Saprospiraceae bacterium]